MVSAALVQTGSDVESKYSYAGSSPTGGADHYFTGTSNKPTTITKNSSTWQNTYNSLGHVTQSIDPSSRTFSYTYASNNIDLIEAEQTQGSNTDIIGQWNYAPSPSVLQHLPLSYIDGSGQKALFTYNSFGELTQRADANGNVWTYTYSSIPGEPLPVYLTQIQGPLSGSQDVTSISYDGYGRVYQTTDSEGYTLTFSYDNADRITQVTYPNGTADKTVYDRLDKVLFTDRLGRTTQYAFDNMDQLSYERDPLGRKTSYTWCDCGSLACITDPAGHSTAMHHDLEGRLAEKIYPDKTQYSYSYNSNGLLQNRTDALNQATNYAYNADFSLNQVSYANAKNYTSPRHPAI